MPDRNEVQTREHVGRIATVLPEAGYGFIAGPGGREVFFHAGALTECELDQLREGEEVRFVEVTEEGRPVATSVHPTIDHEPWRAPTGGAT